MALGFWFAFEGPFAGLRGFDAALGGVDDLRRGSFSQREFLLGIGRDFRGLGGLAFLAAAFAFTLPFGGPEVFLAGLDLGLFTLFAEAGDEVEQQSRAAFDEADRFLAGEEDQGDEVGRTEQEHRAELVEQREEDVVAEQVAADAAGVAGDVEFLASLPGMHESRAAEGEDDEADHRPRPQAGVEDQFGDAEPDQGDRNDVTGRAEKSDLDEAEGDAEATDQVMVWFAEDVGPFRPVRRQVAGGERDHRKEGEQAGANQYDPDDLVRPFRWLGHFAPFAVVTLCHAGILPGQHPLQGAGGQD